MGDPHGEMSTDEVFQYLLRSNDFLVTITALQVPLLHCFSFSIVTEPPVSV